VREDAQVLFGFATEAEKQMFQYLISVNGVGPSTAMVVLSYLPPEELKSAIVREDAAALQAVKGIGGKTALRLILELKDARNNRRIARKYGVNTQYGAPRGVKCVGDFGYCQTGR